MEIAWHANNRVRDAPLYEQVVAAIIERIDEGELRPGMRLPSERDLAKSLGVSRTTAINAYRELAARGIVRRQVGRGTIVCAVEHTADTPFAWRGKVAQGAERAADSGLRALVATPVRNTISFAAGVSALDCFPLDDFRRLTDDVLRRGVDAALGLAPTEGQPALRLELAERYRRDPSGVMVTVGAQQGLDLIARCLLDPGDVVVMDRPGYLGAIHTFRANGARIVGWDVVRHDLTELEDLILRYRPKLLYTTPTFQNPTGRTQSVTTRRELLSLAALYRLPLVEDEPYRELYFRQPPPPSLVELDEQHLVIHLGTFSKTLAAGLRLGWLVAAEPIIEQLAMVKGRTDVFTQGTNQLVVAEMLRTRLFDTHLKNLRQQHEKRYEFLIAALRRWITPGTLSGDTVEGGLYLWCQVSRGINVQRLQHEAVSAGVSFVAGESFYSDGGGRHQLRLCFTSSSTAEIDVGVQRLGRLIKVVKGVAEHGIEGMQPLP